MAALVSRSVPDTVALPAPRNRLRMVLDAALLAAAVALGFTARVTRAKAPVALRHLQDHIYSVLGFGFIDAAAFVHSVFTGLLVTGVSFLVFEWKVGDDGSHP